MTVTVTELESASACHGAHLLMALPRARAWARAWILAHFGRAQGR